MSQGRAKFKPGTRIPNREDIDNSHKSPEAAKLVIIGESAMSDNLREQGSFETKSKKADAFWVF